MVGMGVLGDRGSDTMASSIICLYSYASLVWILDNWVLLAAVTMASEQV